MNLTDLIFLQEYLVRDYKNNLEGTLGDTTVFLENSEQIRQIQKGSIAILSVLDNSDVDFKKVRKQFYKLYKGNWEKPIVDLGEVLQMDTSKDTYKKLQNILETLIKNKIIPIVLGGGHDLTYANYRAYDHLQQKVNLAVVDAKFDLEDKQMMDHTSYLAKIITEKPNNLFNFSNIGYQTYLNSLEHIKLINRLNFDTCRLGVARDTKFTELLLRDADIVSIDICSVKHNDAPASKYPQANGFLSNEICAICRYAGMSDKVSSFGIYEYDFSLDNKEQTAQLIAQMLWHFVEGVNFRKQDYPFCDKENYLKYLVPQEDFTLVFYKSPKSERWWVEVCYEKDNRSGYTLIPCSYEDYLDAVDQNLPEKWYKALNKFK